MVNFDQIVNTYTFYYCIETGVQNEDEASPSISPAGHGQLVKTLIAFEPYGTS